MVKCDMVHVNVWFDTLVFHYIPLLGDAVLLICSLLMCRLVTSSHMVKCDMVRLYACNTTIVNHIEKSTGSTLGAWNPV
jgi:hypothetical protein